MRSIATAFLLTLGTAALAAAEDGRKVDFARDVRPILAAKCFACHGPDAAARKAELRLDVQAEAMKERDGTFAIVAGKPDESTLVERITETDPELRMPPPASEKTLTPQQIATLKAWIAQGAEWSEHWAWTPPKKPAVPPVDEPGFVRNDIDRFILREQTERNLTRAPEADKVTLVRRLSFDLTGLPPTPEDVKAFVENPSPAAYEQLVDRLLPSPHQGERLALYWLDVVRYADTVGIHSDVHRNIDLYRDYVIRAFVENMPFDQFVVEQLAGDLLPEPTREQRIASAYNRLSMTTEEGGAQPKEYLAKYSALPRSLPT
jgi:mono/diheme cytochrome c family protein